MLISSSSVIQAEVSLNHLVQRWAGGWAAHWAYLILPANVCNITQVGPSEEMNVEDELLNL